MSKRKNMKPSATVFQPPPVPYFSVEGTVKEAGEQLGAVWKDTYQAAANSYAANSIPWWQDKRIAKLIRRYAPHLPDLYEAIAKGAGLRPNQISVRAELDAGCTSFSLQPSATLDGEPISGQSKDTAMMRGLQMTVLRMKYTDGAPSNLSLTYPAWFAGYGFVEGGCTMYGNSLYVECDGGVLPLEAFGTLLHHCPDVEHVMRLATDYKLSKNAHLTAADEKGGIVGIENGPGKPVFCKPKRGIYVHANSVLSNKRLLASEKRATANAYFRRSDSEERVKHLTRRFETDRGRLTPQLVYGAMMDHSNYPSSVCRHQSTNAQTTAVVIAQPTLKRIHVVRGPACQNWPQTFTL